MDKRSAINMLEHMEWAFERSNLGVAIDMQVTPEFMVLLRKCLAELTAAIHSLKL